MGILVPQQRRYRSRALTGQNCVHGYVLAVLVCGIPIALFASQIKKSRPIEAAVLDPDRTLALERRLLNNGLRVTANARPARRVTGRVLGLLQSLLQTVGF